MSIRVTVERKTRRKEEIKYVRARQHPPLVKATVPCLSVMATRISNFPFLAKLF